MSSTLQTSGGKHLLERNENSYPWTNSYSVVLYSIAQRCRNCLACDNQRFCNFCENSLPRHGQAHRVVSFYLVPWSLAISMANACRFGRSHKPSRLCPNAPTAFPLSKNPPFDLLISSQVSVAPDRPCCNTCHRAIGGGETGGFSNQGGYTNTRYHRALQAVAQHNEL